MISNCAKELAICIEPGGKFTTLKNKNCEQVLAVKQKTKLRKFLHTATKINKKGNETTYGASSP